MSTSAPAKASLLLQDGTLFTGTAIGAHGTTYGELCFNTGLSGYQEIYTDPSYTGQIVVNTHTHIGNYGVLPAEAESASVKIAGLVVRNYADVYSRAGGASSLQDYLVANGTTGIAGIDTRLLVRKIRQSGVMNAIISSEIHAPAELKARLDTCPSMDGLELSSQVCTTQPYSYGPADGAWRVAVLDLGIKTSILRCLAERGCQLRVYPARTTLAQMEADCAPHGYFISNGPGDPAAMDYAVQTVQAILATGKPLFGICLGHQLLARSQGVGTSKMPYGHRGLNHPILNLETGLAEITSQNHGFVVNRSEAEANPAVKVTHLHLNDHSVAGIRLTDKPAFSVQYHPESSPGPHDSRYLFDNFVNLLKAATAQPQAV